MKTERFFKWVCDNESRAEGKDKRIYIDEEHGVYKEVITFYNVKTGEVFKSKMIIKYRAAEQEFLNENDLYNFLYPL